MKTAPVAYFVYNRPRHTLESLSALARNDIASQTDIYIYSDYPRRPEDQADVTEVRSVVRRVDGFRTMRIIERPVNWGIERSTVDALDSLSTQYGRVICVEDDVNTSRRFLIYLNEGLCNYETDRRVFSITGYAHPASLIGDISKLTDREVYAVGRNCSYGWGTWRDRVSRIDWSMRGASSWLLNYRNRRLVYKYGDDLFDLMLLATRVAHPPWDVRWMYTQLRSGGLTVYPVRSLVDNNGFDDTGLHCEATDRFRNDITGLDEWSPSLCRDMIEDHRIVAAYRQAYKTRILAKFKTILNRCLMRHGYAVQRI